jgi:hypothetical protein
MAAIAKAITSIAMQAVFAMVLIDLSFGFCAVLFCHVFSCPENVQKPHCCGKRTVFSKSSITTNKQWDHGQNHRQHGNHD